jgi:RNA polymerase sigma-70 factor, ECF subfamily
VTCPRRLDVLREITPTLTRRPLPRIPLWSRPEPPGLMLLAVNSPILRIPTVAWTGTNSLGAFSAETIPGWKTSMVSSRNGIRFYLCRQLGPQELDDKVHDAFLIVVQAIKRGDLRGPERLMGFVRTVVRRQVAAYVDDVVHSRREELHLDVGVRVADARDNPEQSAAFQQKVEFMTSILSSLPDRDREILKRFYLDEQTQEQICEEMNLTETQFRLLKSRAKARFGELGKRKLQQKPLGSLFLRTSAQSAH